MNFPREAFAQINEWKRAFPYFDLIKLLNCWGLLFLAAGSEKLHFPHSYRSHERTQEELELVFEELLHIAALSHLSTSIKRELASIIVFEAHCFAGTICKYRRKTLSNTYIYLYILVNISNRRLSQRLDIIVLLLVQKRIMILALAAQPASLSLSLSPSPSHTFKALSLSLSVRILFVWHLDDFRARTQVSQVLCKRWIIYSVWTIDFTPQNA